MAQEYVEIQSDFNTRRFEEFLHFGDESRTTFSHIDKENRILVFLRKGTPWPTMVDYHSSENAGFQ